MKEKEKISKYYNSFIIVGLKSNNLEGKAISQNQQFKNVSQTYTVENITHLGDIGNQNSNIPGPFKHKN